MSHLTLDSEPIEKTPAMKPSLSELAGFPIFKGGVYLDCRTLSADQFEQVFAFFVQTLGAQPRFSEESAREVIADALKKQFASHHEVMLGVVPQGTGPDGNEAFRLQAGAPADGGFTVIAFDQFEDMARRARTSEINQFLERFSTQLGTYLDKQLSDPGSPSSSAAFEIKHSAAHVSLDLREDNDGPRLHLGYLKVDPSLRGQGLGSAILTVLKEQADAFHCEISISARPFEHPLSNRFESEEEITEQERQEYGLAVPRLTDWYVAQGFTVHDSGDMEFPAELGRDRLPKASSSPGA